MTILKRGMIIDVNLDPKMGSETGKIRPCVIVTNDVYNASIQDAAIQTSLSGILAPLVCKDVGVYRFRFSMDPEPLNP